MKRIMLSITAMIATLVFFITQLPIYADDAVAEQNGSLPTISVDKIHIDAGSNVDVPLRISGNTGICGATISVSYDKNIVLKEVKKGTALSTLTMTGSGNLSANPVKIVLDGIEQDNSNGIFATLTFEVPNVNGTYPVTLSYSDGDIVDGNLIPVNIGIQNGFIQVGSLPETTKVAVNIGSEKVTLSGNSTGGIIIVAFFDDNSKLIAVDHYRFSDSINAESKANASYAKVLWWDGYNGMSPLCSAQKVNLKK